MMIYFSWFLALSLSAFSSASKYLQPGKTYHNRTHDTVYLLVELQPEQEFKNESNYHISVLNKHQLYQFSFQGALQHSIDSLKASIENREKRLKNIESNSRGVEQ